MSYNNQPQNDGYVTELPFKCHVGNKPETVSNRFTGEKVELQPDAVAVYDTIIGAERFGMWDTVRAGQDWFRTHYPTEYMILLD